MAGLGIKLFTDEQITPALALALRERSYDVISCHDVGRANQRISDHLQLEYATQEGRTILTYDRADFAQLDAGWRRTGRQHAGIILVPSSVNTFGELLLRVMQHLDITDPEIQFNTVLWLA